MNQVFRLIKMNRVLLANAASLVGSTGITSILGFVYWWLAAREFSPTIVGFASAAISAMMLFGTFAMLGMGTLLMGELSRQSDKAGALISTSLLLVGGVGLGFGIIVAIVSPYVTSSLQGLGINIQSVLLFAVGVSLTAITLVLDQALIGLLQGGLQLWRNALFAAVKLLAVYLASLWLAHTTGLALYTTWTIGNAASLLVLIGIAIVKGARPGVRILPQFSLLRKLGVDAIKHHALNLTLQAPAMLLPVIVTIALSATMNAWFYISWNLSSVGNTVVVSLTMALYAISASQPQVLARKMRLTLGLSLVACVLINIVFLFDTQQVLGIFGKSYAEQSTWILRILSIETFPYIIKAHYIAVSRIQGRVAPTTLITVATGLLELGGSALGVHLGGLTGLGLGWISAMLIEVMFMSPTVYKAVFVTKRSEEKAKTRRELFAEDLDLLDAEAWQSDTLIQPIWVADTLVLNAISLPKRLEEYDIDRMPTIHLASLPPTRSLAADGEATNSIYTRSTMLLADLPPEPKRVVSRPVRETHLPDLAFDDDETVELPAWKKKKK